LEKMFDSLFLGIPRRFFHSVVQRPPGGGPATLVSKTVVHDARRVDDGFAAVRHANGRDWWLIFTNFRSYYDDPDFPFVDPPETPWDFVYANPELFLDTLRFTRYLFTPDSLFGPFPEQEVDATMHPDQTRTIAFSPDGTRYVIGGAGGGSKLFDFDRCTGLMSNPVTIEDYTVDPNGARKAWIAFSPDSRYLYLNDGEKILSQIDLTQTPLVQDTIVQLSGWSYSPAVPGGDRLGIQLNGPDGKIYITSFGGKTMHRIDFPNRAGTDSGFRPHCIALPAINELRGHFNFPNFRLGPVDGSPCDTLGIDNIPLANFRHDVEDTLQPLLITFTDLTDYLPSAWEWDFGDGQSSVLQNPVHAYAQPGTYTVCLRTTNQNGADTICKNLQIDVVGTSVLAHTTVELQLSPNPTTGTLLATLNGTAQAVQLLIHDCLGKLTASKSLIQGIDVVDISDLPPGIYYYQALNSGKRIGAGKIVKTE
jgi:PKD repeat protein